MPSHLVGETAGLATSVLWTACAVLFASAGRRIGALSVNAYRIVIACLFLGVTHLVVFRSVVPPANAAQWFYMGLSGLVGLALGDFGYFGALVLVGPRMGVLIMSMAPIFSAVAAYFILGEVLAPWNLVGVALTLSGVALAVFDSAGRERNQRADGKRKLYGVLSGLGGSVGQGLGFVISKYGMVVAGGEGTPNLNPLSATLVRMVVAAGFVWLFVAASGRLGRVLDARKDRPAILRTFAGAVSGPFIGVWLSMVAVAYALAGVAATLMALMPVMIIPVVWLVYRERTSYRGMVGAAVAVVGVAILFVV